MLEGYRMLTAMPAYQLLLPLAMSLAGGLAVGLVRWKRRRAMLGLTAAVLAANLLVDENPTAASFYEQRYEEMRNLYFARRPAEDGEEIVDMYGGIEYGRFGRW